MHIQECDRMKKEIIEVCEGLNLEVYVTPEIEAVLFDAEDIIVTSGIIETPVIPFSSRNSGDIW